MTRIETAEVDTGQTTIFLQKSGSGPAVLLLHGFPETQLMWRGIIPMLAEYYTVICPDLRGYGKSGCPASDNEHMCYSKRVMAMDMVSVMGQLGFGRFAIAGHDRGGRVAYRLALDHPDKVAGLAVLDIIPTLDVWNLADKKFALAYWPWVLLSQAYPLPEQLIRSSPQTLVDDAVNLWGTSNTAFDDAVRAAYTQQLLDPLHVHAICEEYRAAATIDCLHDQHDKNNNLKIQCPLLALWAEAGPLDTWYVKEGGPLGIWRNWATTVEGKAMKGGHFFPEERPAEVAAALLNFFSGLRTFG